MNDKRTIVNPLHPEMLKESGVYHLQYRWMVGNEIGLYTETVVFKGMILPTSADEDKSLLLILCLTRRPRKGEKKVFSLPWSKVVQMEYLHRKG